MANLCSMCRENPAAVRVHVDGIDVWWCGDCIADRIRETRVTLRAPYFARKDDDAR